MADHAWYSPPDGEPLSKWIAALQEWQRTYGDVKCTAQVAGLNEVELRLTLEKPKRGKGSKHRSRKARPSD